MLSGGILLLAVEAGRHRARQGQSVAFGGLNAMVIVAYTLVDGSGVRMAGDAWSYAAWLFVLNALPLLALLRLKRGPAFLRRASGGRAKLLAGGVFTFASYGLALWAMTRAPIALVAALRECAVVFGLVLAALLLKERFGPARWAASILVAAGAGALKLA
jgi:drug/metabolite transporter (DMT)-like permease